MERRSLRLERGLRAVENEPVFKDYRPEFLSEGGDQLVFTLPGHPQSVVKVRKEWIKQIILSPDLHNVSFSDAPSDYRDIVFAELQDERARFLTLKKYFPDMVLQERFSIVRLPVDDRIVREVFDDISLSQKIFIDVPVRIQERKDLKCGEFVSLTHGYVGVKNNFSLDQFLNSLASLLFTQKPLRHYSHMLVLLSTLRQAFPRGQQLNEVMCNFVESAALYTQNEDQILDVVGTNNIVLDRGETDLPRVTFLDALCPRSGLTFSRFRSTVNYAGKRDLRGRELNDIKNGLHYARFMSSLAYEFAPQCVAAFCVPELAGQRALINVYRALYS